MQNLGQILAGKRPAKWILNQLSEIQFTGNLCCTAKVGMRPRLMECVKTQNWPPVIISAITKFLIGATPPPTELYRYSDQPIAHQAVFELYFLCSQKWLQEAILEFSHSLGRVQTFAAQHKFPANRISENWFTKSTGITRFRPEASVGWTICEVYRLLIRKRWFYTS